MDAPTDQAPALVLGLDVGGTSTRALVATADGVRVGAGRAAGGNPTGLGPARAAAAQADAVGQALSGLDPAAVRYVVLGLAGGAALPSGEDMPAGEAFARVWERAGLSCPVEYQGDALIAFVAGTDRPEGSLLLSGTGAVAIAVKDRAMAARSDGHGWLLGDRGSGFWLGRQAVVAAMAELDGEGPPTVLTGLVIESLSLGGAVPGTESASVFPEGAAPVPASPASSASASPAGPIAAPIAARDLVTAVMSQPPPNLARLAPLLATACAAGDRVAEGIADRAAAYLAATLSAVRGPAAATPIVLAGSILTNPTPVAARVRTALAERWPDAVVTPALDGAAAAVWLALDRFGRPPSPAVRERLFSVSTAS
ncbi:BadF/BadG/BcrA/BcrD ATPase family protein [Catenulispora yoronensis]|uniref:BadF/BadG/BcrA/BcrD ATPase family protein n=1 Tax=Catenulispora yoronensis TaxID=450799 RepID=A0ABP5GRM5_9ACTN